MNNNNKEVNQKDLQILSGLKNKLIKNCEAAIVNVDYLKSSIQNFEEAAKESIDSNISYANIITKYATGESNSYNLPGVIADVTATYDIKTMQADKANLMNAKSSKESSENQKEMYYKMLVQNYNDLRQVLTSLANTTAQVSQYIEIISNSTDNS